MSKSHSVLGTLLLAGLLASCNNSGGSKSPRLSSVPLQTVSGASTFALDLKKYVNDDTQTSTYTVNSGGGSFTGSVYSHTFPTLGTYTVKFTVTDFRGNATPGSFQVKVTSAELGVVREGTGVSLLDFGTSNFKKSVIQDDGTAKTYKAALSTGSLVFEVTVTGQKDIWLYDPNAAKTEVIAGDASQAEAYVLKSSKDFVLFVRGASPNRSLRLWSPLTKSHVQIGTATGSRDERDAVINSNDRIYFESAEGGLADIYYHDVKEATTKLVSNNAADEDIVGTLQNGGVVFRRKGAGGEWDLFYFNTGTGVVEIGVDLGTTKNLESKSFGAGTSDSRVVFGTTDGSGDDDLYIWNPANGQTTTILANAVDETFVALSGSGRVIFKIQTGTSNADLSVYDASNNTTTVIANSANDETYKGTLTNGDVIYERDTGASGKDLYHFDQSGSTSTAFTGATTTAVDHVFAKVLKNNDVVYTVGSDLWIFRESGSSYTSVTTAAGTETYAGETSGGDFVINLVTGGNTHLYLWDSSANSASAIVTETGTAAFQAASSTGKILYTRKATGATTTNLFLHGTPAKQLTDNTKDDKVDAVVSASVQ